MRCRESSRSTPALFLVMQNWIASRARRFKQPTSSSRHGPAAVREQQPPDICGRYRGAEQIALHFGTAEDVEQISLLLGLDTLRRRRHVAGSRDVHHGLGDGGGCGGTADIPAEGAIDLYLVEPETLQVAERGIPGAEIVQRDP